MRGRAFRLAAGLRRGRAALRALHIFLRPANFWRNFATFGATT